MTLRERAKALSFRLFALGDRGGLHVLPAHYYSSLPRWSDLRANEERWRRPAPLVGIHWDLEEQAAWLRANVGTFAAELPLPRLMADADAVGGFRYGPIEAQALYGIVRTRRPRRIVEIGSGSTTLVMSLAVQANVSTGHAATDIAAFDPYTAGRVAGLPHVSAARVHGIDLTPDDLALEAGDVLFIDSTHAVRTGSEVPHLYLDVLPALPPGVLVQIHDVYLPYLFTPLLYETYFDWQETTLVAALLVNNPALRVRAGMAALAHAASPVLAELFPEYRPSPIERGMMPAKTAGHLPCSLWLETVAVPS